MFGAAATAADALRAIEAIAAPHADIAPTVGLCSHQC